MDTSGSDMNFEVRAAYLEGRADLAERVVGLVMEARDSWSITKMGLCDRLLAICSATMQYDTLESA